MFQSCPLSSTIFLDHKAPNVVAPNVEEMFLRKGGVPQSTNHFGCSLMVSSLPARRKKTPPRTAIQLLVTGFSSPTLVHFIPITLTTTPTKPRIIATTMRAREVWIWTVKQEHTLVIKVSQNHFWGTKDCAPSFLEDHPPPRYTRAWFSLKWCLGGKCLEMWCPTPSNSYASEPGGFSPQEKLWTTSHAGTARRLSSMNCPTVKSHPWLCFGAGQSKTHCPTPMMCSMALDGTISHEPLDLYDYQQAETSLLRSPTVFNKAHSLGWLKAVYLKLWAGTH